MTRTLVFLSLLSGCIFEESPDDSGSTTEIPSIPVPDGYTATQTLRHGSEAKLIGEPGLALDLPGYRIISATLSGDGQVAWFSVQYDWADEGDKYRVFSMRTDGTQLHESELVRPSDAPYHPGGFIVRTSGDGEVALLTQYTYDSEDRVVAQFSLATRGEDFQVVGTSNGEAESLGLAQSVNTELTDAGDAVVFTTGQRLWRADAASGWVPFEIDNTQNLTWDGEPPPWNSNFESLDVNISGGEWISHIWLNGDDHAVVTGTSVATYGIEDVSEADVYHGVQMDDAGEVVAWTAVPHTSYIGEQGGVHRQIEVPVGEVWNVALADGGEVFHGSARTAQTVMPFFERVDGSGREASLTPTWTTYGTVPAPVGQLSDDGQVFVTRTPAPLIHHRDAEVFGAGVDAVFWKEEGDEVVIRAVVHHEDELVSVVAHPVLDDWMPPRAQYGYDEDPTNLIRLGLHLLPIEDEPGHYEGRFTPRAEASLPFDNRYSFRVVVNQGADGTALSNGYLDVRL